MPGFLVNSASVDYLSLSTFSQKEFDKIVAWGVDSTDSSCEIKGVRRMQYLGQQQDKQAGGSFFWGTAEQAGRDHYLCQTSGAFSHTMARLVFGSTWESLNCTRLDIQLTLKTPDWYKSRHLTDWLRAADWPGRRRKITTVDGAGLDTVYIGSRQSDRFCRIYNKDSEWLRLEFEYKADRAIAAATAIFREGTEMGCYGLLHHELASLPQHPIIAAFRNHIVHYGPINPQLQRQESNTYKWFVRTIVPALVKLLNDDDYTARVACILDDLLKDLER